MKPPNALKKPSTRSSHAPAYGSILAGCIADAGRGLTPLMKATAEIVPPFRTRELMWDHPRELLNIIHVIH